jgi:S1-C subfamily serine protease
MNQGQQRAGMGAPLFAALVFLTTTTVTLTVIVLRREIAEEPQGNPDDPLELHQPREVGGTHRFTAEEEVNVRIFREASPSVVHVDAVGVALGVKLADKLPPGVGSGFVWSDRGYIVTSWHVIEGRSGETSVTLADGSRWPAKYVGHDEAHDLAVLAIAAPRELLHPIALGTSKDLLRGQRVFAIGNPFGLDHTLTVGVVSGTDRPIRGGSGVVIQGMIQTDAAINPGNSGGPLLNSSGQLIGINTAMHAASRVNAGVGFAVPVDIINTVVPNLLQQGFEPWPELGITLSTDEQSRELLRKAGWNAYGVVVLEVTPDSPAGRAGLRPIRATHGRGGAPEDINIGDIIVGINGLNLSSRDQLSAVLGKLAAGDRVDLELRRAGKPLDMQLDFGSR